MLCVHWLYVLIDQDHNGEISCSNHQAQCTFQQFSKAKKQYECCQWLSRICSPPLSAWQHKLCKRWCDVHTSKQLWTPQDSSSIKCLGDIYHDSICIHIANHCICIFYWGCSQLAFDCVHVSCTIYNVWELTTLCISVRKLNGLCGHCSKSSHLATMVKYSASA